jgi:hypothetical protein
MLLLVLACAQRAERLDRPEQLLARLESGQGPPVQAAVLGPAGRELRALQVQVEEPEQARSDLAGFDPGGVDAAWRFEHGDPGARELLAEALRRESSRPTVAPSGAWEGLSGRGARLRQAAESGLRLDRSSSEALDDAIARRGCGQACDEALLEVLWQEPDPFGELALLEVELPVEAPLLSSEWEERLAGRVDVELLREAVAWVPEGQAAVLLGLVASPLHAYGPGVIEAGQAGEPADVLRYGGGSPGATAVAALLLAESSSVRLELRTDGRRVLLSSGDLRAWVGPCGPGVAPAPPHRLRPLELDEALEWAAAERVVAALGLGDVDAAVELSRELRDPPSDYAPVHVALLSAQGIEAPGSDAASLAYALRWTAAAGGGAPGDEHPRVEPLDGAGISPCSRFWKPLPSWGSSSGPAAVRPTD